MAADPIELAKAELRTTVRGLLAAMTPEERSRESAGVCTRAMSWGPMAEAACVMGYMPMAREVDIRPMIETLLVQGVTVCLPRVDWKRHRLRPVPIRDLDRDLGARERGVRQPRADIAPIADECVQVVILPGLAFDRRGGRLGQGGGFYDRWLADRAENVRTLGVAFGCQVVDRVPMLGHDRRVAAVASVGGLHVADRQE